MPFTKEELEAAPADTIGELTKEDGLYARQEAYSYYKIDPYWN